MCKERGICLRWKKEKIIYNCISTSLAVDIDFMKNVSGKFILNLLNFVTLASFSWECSLKINVNMILNSKNCISGGITRPICHYAGAKNKYMHDYDEKKKVHKSNILVLRINMDEL